MLDSQRYPRNHYLINNVENVVVFNSDFLFDKSGNAQITFLEKLQLKTFIKMNI